MRRAWLRALRLVCLLRGHLEVPVEPTPDWLPFECSRCKSRFGGTPILEVEVLADMQERFDRADAPDRLA